MVAIEIESPRCPPGQCEPTFIPGTGEVCVACGHYVYPRQKPALELVPDAHEQGYVAEERLAPGEWTEWWGK